VAILKSSAREWRDTMDLAEEEKSGHLAMPAQPKQPNKPPLPPASWLTGTFPQHRGVAGSALQLKERSNPTELLTAANGIPFKCFSVASLHNGGENTPKAVVVPQPNADH
jgi:hypothetical protein